MSKYRVRSKHAIDLPNGRTAAPHDVVEASERDRLIKTLIEDGVLIKLQSMRGTK